MKHIHIKEDACTNCFITISIVYGLCVICRLIISSVCWVLEFHGMTRLVSAHLRWMRCCRTYSRWQPTIYSTMWSCPITYTTTTEYVFATADIHFQWFFPISSWYHHQLVEGIHRQWLGHRSPERQANEQVAILFCSKVHILLHYGVYSTCPIWMAVSCC